MGESKKKKKEEGEEEWGVGELDFGQIDSQELALFGDEADG